MAVEVEIDLLVNFHFSQFADNQSDMAIVAQGGCSRPEGRHFADAYSATLMLVLKMLYCFGCRNALIKLTTGLV